MAFIACIRPLYSDVYDFTSNNSIELLKDSKNALEIKLELIKKAKHHIHIMSYFLDNSKYPQRVYEELHKAHQRGVEVRIVTTFIPTFVKDLTLKTKRELKEKDTDIVFSYLLLGPSGKLTVTNNIHEKVLLVDGDVAVIGGRNLSDSAYNAKDLEVLVRGGIVNQLQEHFLKIYTFALNRKIKKFCAYKNKSCINRLRSTLFERENEIYFPKLAVTNGVKARLLTHNAVLIQDEKGYKHDDKITMDDDIVNAVTSVKFNKMRAYNYYILPTPKYKKFLISNINENKDIKIITNSLETSGIVSNKGYIYSLPIMNELVKEGIEIYQWQGPDGLQYLHEKVILFDDEQVFIGSHNFGTGSTATSNELCIEFFSPELALDLITIFDDETKDLSKTIKATNISLAHEIQDNLKMIKFLNKTFIGDFLEESY